jgi:hypothetical protein
MPGQLDRIRDRRGSGPDHQPPHRQPRLAVGGHDLAPLRDRERGRLAGGAQHVERIAAMIEEKTRERARARAIGLAGLVDGGGDGGDHAGHSGFGHGLSSVQKSEIGNQNSESQMVSDFGVPTSDF